MNELQPTLWRTCRVLANESRLRLLYLLFEHKELCSRDLAFMTGLSEPQASIHLRLLNSRGLIRQHRTRMRLLSSPQANPEIRSASLLMQALHQCHDRDIPTEQLFRQVTAFTHARRIEIIQKIPPEGISNLALSEKSGIAISAINRHLRKLKARNLIKEDKGRFTVSVPQDPLSKTLLRLIRYA